jgi:hypothetical protein
MANLNNPHGLMPLGISLSGAPNAIEVYTKVVGTTGAIYRWDAVARLSGGSLASNANLTAGTTLFSGVALNFGATLTATDHHVVISPDAMYECQANSTGLTAADEGLNTNLVLTAGSTTTKLSGNILSNSSATTATLDVHLLKLYALVDNVAGAYARFEVVFNRHRMANQVVGV